MTRWYAGRVNLADRCLRTPPAMRCARWAPDSPARIPYERPTGGTMRLPSLRHRTDDPASRDLGQSLVELALVVPVLLLIVLTAVDFGRVYLGYVNLQQMARVAGAFAAEHAEALDRAIPDPTVLDRYRKLIGNDASKLNCTPDPIA